jgi:hypothetical protein
LKKPSRRHYCATSACCSRRALSDLGRHDLALEVAANLEGREAIRLRSDILWAGSLV